MGRTRNKKSKADRRAHFGQQANLTYTADDISILDVYMKRRDDKELKDRPLLITGIIYDDLGKPSAVEAMRLTSRDKTGSSFLHLHENHLKNCTLKGVPNPVVDCGRTYMIDIQDIKFQIGAVARLDEKVLPDLVARRVFALQYSTLPLYENRTRQQNERSYTSREGIVLSAITKSDLKSGQIAPPDISECEVSFSHNLPAEFRRFSTSDISAITQWSMDSIERQLKQERTGYVTWPDVGNFPNWPGYGALEDTHDIEVQAVKKPKISDARAAQFAIFDNI